VTVVAEEWLKVLVICNSPYLFGGEPSATKLRALLGAVADAVGGCGHEQQGVDAGAALGAGELETADGALH